MEILAKLPAAFRDGGSVTAGNSSGINDAACAMIIASEAAAKANGLTPRARILATVSAGVPPRVMGIGPVPATQKLLAKLGMTVRDFDVIELNEAFAAQALAVLRQLGLSDDAENVNPNGGAIALGHPLGASGGRLMITALNQLEATGGKRALCTMCIGVGQGIALAIERVYAVAWRLMPAWRISVSMRFLLPSRSMAAVASCTTATSKPAWRASIADQATQ